MVIIIIIIIIPVPSPSPLTIEEGLLSTFESLLINNIIIIITITINIIIFIVMKKMGCKLQQK